MGNAGDRINSRMIQVENAGKELAADFAESGTNPMSSFEQIGKRAFDIAAATIALLLLSPLILLVCLVIKLDSRGPILCRYKRCGINNKTIEVFEFRSATAGHESQTVDHAARKNCSVTRFGGILRGSDIDKIPQLINVLRGEMSIVGPRLYSTALSSTLRAQISLLPDQRHVKPGIFSWAQVNGYREETDNILENFEQRVAYDLYYINNQSLLLDLKIILLAFFSMKTRHLGNPKFR
jgi:lipopolysaccharide/colanic/teichoic acid biosynthesis glycosyltransferase